VNLSVIANLSRDVLRLFFPIICTLCGDRLNETDQVICDRCRREMPRVLDPTCRRCGNPAVRVASDTCRLCRKMKPSFDCARAVAIYAGPAEQLVRDLKYDSRLELGPVMAGMMVVTWERSMAFERIDVVIPVPLHPARRRERGFNQAEHIAAPFAEMMNAPMSTEAVVRVRPTVSQTRLDLAQRVENVDGAFEPAAESREELDGKSVVLIDDVCTTGATGSACAEAIRQAGAPRVVLFTFARASFAT
jgi:ComF family protein